MQSGFVKSCRTDLAIEPYSIVAHATTAKKVRKAVAATDPLAGVTDSQGGPAGGMVDVQMTEYADVRLGGTVASGDRLTANANGFAVKAAKVTGQLVSYVGIAQAPGVAGDIIDVLIVPGFIDG